MVIYLSIRLIVITICQVLITIYKPSSTSKCICKEVVSVITYEVITISIVYLCSVFFTFSDDLCKWCVCVYEVCCTLTVDDFGYTVILGIITILYSLTWCGYCDESVFIIPLISVDSIIYKITIVIICECYFIFLDESIICIIGVSVCCSLYSFRDKVTYCIITVCCSSVIAIRVICDSSFYELIYFIVFIVDCCVIISSFT